MGQLHRQSGEVRFVEPCVEGAIGMSRCFNTLDGASSIAAPGTAALQGFLATEPDPLTLGETQTWAPQVIPSPDLARGRSLLHGWGAEPGCGRRLGPLLRGDQVPACGKGNEHRPVIPETFDAKDDVRVTPPPSRIPAGSDPHSCPSNKRPGSALLGFSGALPRPPPIRSLIFWGENKQTLVMPSSPPTW